MRFRLALFTILALVGMFLTSQAMAVIPGKRVALVVGNQNYDFLKTLSNPKSDATKVAAALKARKFTLVGDKAQTDVTKGTLRDLIAQFKKDAQGAELAFFFFSGHGTQINGINYVTGKDTGVLTPASADLEAVRAEFALNVMAEAGVETAVMMLDACRNAPITKGTGKDIGEGFAAMRTPIGALISFATDPGDVADDGVPGENSPYTTSWLEEIEVPGEELGQIFRHVERKVMARTGNEQRPWTQSSGLKDVILTPKGPSIVTPSNNNSNGGKVQPGPGSIVIIPSPTLVQKNSPEAEKLAQDAEDALENKQYQLAYNTIAQAIAKDPNYSRVYNVAGYIAYKEYQTSPVIKYIIDGPQASLDDRKKMYDAIYPAFNDKVLSKYDKAASLDGTAMSPLRNRGFAVLLVYQIQSAIGYRLGNLLDNALTDFDAAITRYPTSAKSYYGKGIVYLYKGDYANALAAFGRAYQIDEKFAASLAGQCAVLARKGDAAAAQAFANEAAKKSSFYSDQACLRTPTFLLGAAL